jgi:hypothetical protein
MQTKQSGALMAVAAAAVFTLLSATVIADETSTSSVSVGPDGVHATTTTTTAATNRVRPKKHHKSKKPKLNDNGHNGNNGLGYNRNNSQN